MSRSADLKLDRFLDEIDRMAPEPLHDADAGVGWRPAPTVADDHPPTALGLGSIGTVIWATGHRPEYPWIPSNLLDAKGRICHTGGVLAQPGLYAIGLPFTRSRKSALIGGVGRDAVVLSAHLARYLARGSRSGPSRAVHSEPSRRPLAREAP